MALTSWPPKHQPPAPPQRFQCLRCYADVKRYWPADHDKLCANCWAGPWAPRAAYALPEPEGSDPTGSQK